MGHFKLGKIITGILVIFICSCILPSCATTNMSQSETATRHSLMLQKDSQLHKGVRTRQAKASRGYKKSKKKNNMYKSKKHKYSKRKTRKLGNKRRR